MSKAKENQMKKADFEILFKDSPDYYVVQNAKMIFESQMVRFICFDGDKFKGDEWYPMVNIQRIKRYPNE